METVLVTGATGQQGGATVRALLARGWRVRALVRDTDTAAARALADAGAQLVRGDMTDRDSLDTAVKDAYGVFSVQPAAGPAVDEEREVTMGRTVADAALAAGVEHLVYASVAGADRATGVNHWTTKWRIEEHIRALGIPATMLRPVMFMENHASRGPFGIAGDTALLRVIPPESTVQMIAVPDIGQFAALALTDPDRYRGRAIEIAGDELTREELIAAVERAIGRPVNTDPPPDRSALRVDTAKYRGKPFAGWQADIPALRSLYPDLMTFDAWLARGGAARLRALTA